MLWWRIAKFFISFLYVGFCASHLAVASEYHGQVTFGGYPVPGAIVTATQGEMKIAVVTNAEGVYSFTELANGYWSIEVEMQCFSAIQADITVTANTPLAKWNMTLLPHDQLMMIAKQPANKVIVQLMPSITEASKKAAAATSPNGVLDMPIPQEEQNSLAADGLLLNGSVNNGATSQYALSQAFGNGRSGSKSLYNGGASAIFANSSFDARPYSLSGIEAEQAPYDRFTGTVGLGGPIKIPHLLQRGPNFFASYQWTRNQTAQTLPSIVPTATERTGDLADLLGAQGGPVTIYDPATGLPFPGNTVPVSSQAQALLKLYPLPNITGNSLYNYQTTVLNSSHQDTTYLRLNKSFGRKDELMGSFDSQDTRASSTSIFGFVDTTNTLGINTSVNWEHRLGQHIHTKLCYNFSRMRTDVISNFEGRQNVSGTAGITGNDQDKTDWGPPTLNFSSGVAALSDANSSFNRSRTDAFSASANLYRRKHNITLGADLRKQQYNYFFQENPRGSFTFTGSATEGTTSSGFKTGGSDLADFLIGVPDTSSVAFGNADKYFRQPVYDAYVTDDWRILSVLTINVGLRWEYGAPMTEVHGRLVNLDITPGFTAAAPVVGSDPVGAITGNHYPSSLVRPDKLDVEPRVGVAWRPIPASTIVVRAGYGIYHDTSIYLAPALQLAQQAPLSKSLSVENNTDCPLTLAKGFNNCSSVIADNFAIDPNFRVGYAQTWQLAMQRDLPAALQLTVTYLGVKGTHGVQQFLPNTYPIGATNPCPDCPLGFVYRTSGGNSTRQSGQLQLRRRLRSGFTASLLYTWSKSIDDDAQLGGQGHVTSSEQNNGSAASTAAIAQNWLKPRAEYSLSNFDQRHRLNLQAQYTSGAGLGGGDLMRGWTGRLLKEWTVLASIVTSTGFPETPSYLAAVPGTGFSNTIRPNLTGAHLYSSQADLHLNSAAYSAPTSGQWGSAGRNSITGPGQFSLDSSLARTFRPSQKYSLDVRVDATNLLNHAVFTGWNSIWNSTQFGAPSAANAMRSLQTTLRLRF
jgi:hypothetical protein